MNSTESALLVAVVTVIVQVFLAGRILGKLEGRIHDLTEETRELTARVQQLHRDHVEHLRHNHGVSSPSFGYGPPPGGWGEGPTPGAEIE